MISMVNILMESFIILKHRVIFSKDLDFKIDTECGNS